MEWLLWTEKHENLLNKELASTKQINAELIKKLPTKTCWAFDLVFPWVNRIQGHEYKLLLT